MAIDLVQKNYAELTSLPKAENSNKHQPFSEAELQLLWDNHNDPVFGIGVQLVLIYCYTGLRPTELLKIKIENVHLDERYMLGGLKTAAGRNRVIPIAERIYPFVAHWFNPDNEYLITTANGPLLNYDKLRDQFWSKTMAHFNMVHLPHDCRVTFATRADERGIPENIYKKILGHAGKDITQKVYVRKTIAELVSAVNLL